MKHTKERVLALDYFRGVCIIMVAVNHAGVFSRPFNYLTGAGNLWTSAAAMFFLISGITLAVVRAPLINSDFKTVVKKSWARGRYIYQVHLLALFGCLALASLLVGAHLFNYVPGTPPANSGFSLLWRTLALAYSPGWANFLMFYAVYMLVAPFALKALHKSYWAVVPLASAILLVACAPYPLHLINLGNYAEFGLWQIYFFLGLTLGRFRRPIISRLYSLPSKLVGRLRLAVITLAVVTLGISALIDFRFYPIITNLSSHGWLPLKLQAAYIHLINHSQTIFLWMTNNRWGLLRPLVSLLVLAAAYLFYQQHKQFLQTRTGRVINTMGRDTLWLFVAQALLVPALAALPLPRNIFTSVLLTSLLLTLMWLVTQRKDLLTYTKTNMRAIKNLPRRLVLNQESSE